MEFPRIPNWVEHLAVVLMLIGALSVVAAIIGAVIWALNHIKIV